MMKRLFNILCALFLLTTVSLQAQTTVSGVIMDEELNEPLIGANVIIVGTTIGASTDLDGNYSITSDNPLPWTLEVSYTGFAPKTMTVTGSNANLNINLASSAIIGQEVVISASRRREKIQEAPASISVLSAKSLEATPNENAARSIINMPGVTVQQQSAGRINIQLRGDGGIFGSASFPILDYRSLSGPGLGTFDALNSPLNNMDIQRIEVVRGPGSALYGPGVTSGVVHFITKSAIDNPGTSIELIGGELNTFGGSFRHATKVSDKFGFKIGGVIKRGDEFTLRQGVDDARIALLSNTIRRPVVVGGIVDGGQQGEVLWGPEDTDPDGDGNPLKDSWDQQSITANLEFRPQDDLSFNLSGGWNQASAVFFNSQGEGLTQSREIWAQARLQKGGLFAQAFVLNNNGTSDDRPTFLYQTGLETGIARTQIEAQVQYNFDTPNLLNANWTAGFDFRTNNADSKNQVYGRNEDDDAFSIFGGYLQGKFALGKKLDLVLAGRADRFNFLDETAFSPRAVFVWKPSPTHTFRGGFNRAVGTPSQLQINIDFPVSAAPGMDIWLVGNKNEQTFNDNPQIEFNSLLQAAGIPNLPLGTPGFPNAIAYGAVNGAVQAQLIPGISAALQGGGADAATADAISQAIAGYLNDPTNTPAGFTGQFTGINLFNRQPLGLVNAPAAKLRTEDTWEVGYKGLIGDRLGVTLDVYNREIDGATLFTGISPNYILSGANYAQDLASDVANPALRDFIFNTLGGAANPAAGPTADLLLGAIEGAYLAGGTGFADAIGPNIDALNAGGILATTPTDNVPSSGNVKSAAGYRTFEAFDYWGADFGLQYYVSEDLSFFGNYSWVSDNEFNPVVVGSEGQTALTSQSVPLNKYRLGANYTPEFGLRWNVAFQHDDSFFANLGQYTGDTDVKNLVDAGVGYKFDNGLALDLTAQNLFDNEYRIFPNFPIIGRRVLGKLTYHFGGDMGRKQDADGDGISDSKDNCPNTAGLKEFGGCPDSDGDGIMDSADACPLAAGLASTNGCPDGDGDGVADVNDACPTVAGNMNGCPDSDGDGVADNEDACPNAAGPIGGCPDADGDGVADKDDACPNAAGPIGGCPDSDGDGVADANDACPNAAGPIGGCPDGDGDGVADKDDACPTVAASTANGCPADPDTDGDGVPDSRDACPNASGTANGCPDGDGDGVADRNDACPTVAASTANGCPAIPASVTEVFNRALQGVQFETGSNRIRTSSKTILRDVINIMNDNPSYKLNIGGHTDSIGSSESNQQLSQRRADAVKKYLTDRGVDASRVSAVGYGESQPVADNKYSAGRKQNRRVELSVNY